MILSFEFNYVSQNGVLQNLLAKICEDFQIDYKINKKETIVTLFVDANEEKLGSFSDFLSARLPLSIFFKSSSVSVVDTMPEVNEVPLCDLTFPYTPKALQSVKTESSELFCMPFVLNELGNEPFIDSSRAYMLNANGEPLQDATDTNSFVALYKTIANALVEGKRVLIDSPSGEFIYSKVELVKELSSNFQVLATDLSVVEKMVVIKENEIKAIASLEKPALRLKVNSLYSAKGILSTNRVKLKLADDLFLFLLTEEVFKKGVDFLVRTAKDEGTYDFSVGFDGKVSYIPQIEASVLENGEILIISGDGYSAKIVRENLSKFDNPAHAQFTSVIQEHNLFGEQCSCFYLSKTHDDKFLHVSEQTGMLDLVSFPIEKSFEKIFNKIKESSTGEQLLENYTKQYPELVQKALNIKIPENAPNSIYTMWAICSILLGFSDSFEDAAEKLIENAEDFGGQKGPRIDYQLFSQESIVSNFNFIKMIRSAMSFKLAGTDDRTLSFGFIESLAYFLSDSTDFYRENLTSRRMVLCGAMYGIKRFCELAARNITATSKISFNRELSIDH